MIDLVSARRSLRLSPASFRRVTLFAVWALGFTIVTGAAVRLTGSGLGCPDWPTCAHNQVVAPWQYRPMVEFGNRVVTLAVSIAMIASVLASAVRIPRRRDLSWLSWGLVAGLVAEIVLGGESVRHQLAPPYIMGHFLLSIVLLTDAVVLHHRAGFADRGAPDPGPPAGAGRTRGPRARAVGPAVALVSAEQLVMGRVLAVAAGAAIALGTVVTSSGPHGGDPKARRLGFAVHDVARLHSSMVLLFLAITVATLLAMMRSGAPSDVIRRGEVLLGVLLVQGAVGYLQYFSGVPTWLVEIHVTLAALLWAVTVQFVLGLTVRPQPPIVADRESVEGGRLVAAV